MSNGKFPRALLAAVLLWQCTATGSAAAATAPATPAANTGGYAALVQLFGQWREFEHPALAHGIADYSASAMAAKATALPQWRSRLEALDRSGWSIAQLNDYQLVKAEINGLDFNLRVLRPWARDPAF